MHVYDNALGRFKIYENLQMCIYSQIIQLPQRPGNNAVMVAWEENPPTRPLTRPSTQQIGA
jgi:hypothetical protein